LYAGEVRLADRSVGRLLRAVDELGLRESTAVVFLSDHGIFLGEHDLLGKSNKARDDVDGWPPYREVSEIPMLLRVPGVAPRRAPAVVHPGDLMLTLLELAGAPVATGATASSLMPLVRREMDTVRDVAVTAWSYRGWSHRHPSRIRHGEWSMIWWRTGIRP